jgi:hypothetical protein
MRDDKSWYECPDLDELEKLRTMAKGKLSYQHTSTSSEPAPKKRKRVVTRVEKPLTVAKHFAAADASGVQEVKNTLPLSTNSANPPKILGEGW